MKMLMKFSQLLWLQQSLFIGQLSHKSTVLH